MRFIDAYFTNNEKTVVTTLWENDNKEVIELTISESERESEKKSNLFISIFLFIMIIIFHLIKGKKVR